MSTTRLAAPSGLLSLSVALFAQTKPAVPYGSSTTAGRTFVHEGVKLYYETYGAGEPLLLVHGNGGQIRHLAAQIDHFRKRYRVIAMDSRDHGNSADSPGPLTYEKMTADLAALMDHLKLGPVNVLGWSDGGIEALLLAMHYPCGLPKLDPSVKPTIQPCRRRRPPRRRMVESIRAGACAVADCCGSCLLPNPSRYRHRSPRASPASRRP